MLGTHVPPCYEGWSSLHLAHNYRTAGVASVIVQNIQSRGRD